MLHNLKQILRKGEKWSAMCKRWPCKVGKFMKLLSIIVYLAIPYSTQSFNLRKFFWKFRYSYFWSNKPVYQMFERLTTRTSLLIVYVCQVVIQHTNTTPLTHSTTTHDELSVSSAAFTVIVRCLEIVCTCKSYHSMQFTFLGQTVFSGFS